MERLFSLFLWIIVAFTGILLIELSLPYTTFKPNIDFLRTKQLIYHKDIWRWAFYVHVFTSPVAYITALIQFLPFVKHKVRTHQINGWIFFISYLALAGPSGFILAIYANGGFWGQTSFLILSFLWMTFGIMAFRSAINHDYQAHINWVMRSLFLMSSAVFLRFYAYLLGYFHIDLHPKSAYILIAWISWVPNLILGEFILKRDFVQRFLQKQYWPNSY